MKVFAIALALATAAVASPASAQLRGQVLQPANGCAYTRSSNSVGDIIFGRTSASTCQDVYSREDGAWYQIGRGANNNSVYERRVRDNNGNLIIQRARRNSNGRFTILSSRVATSNDKQWRKAEKSNDKQWRKAEKAREKAYRKEQKAENKAYKNHK
jgi:hypothetical protein